MHRTNSALTAPTQIILSFTEENIQEKSALDSSVDRESSSEPCQQEESSANNEKELLISRRTTIKRVWPSIDRSGDEETECESIKPLPNITKKQSLDQQDFKCSKKELLKNHRALSYDLKLQPVEVMAKDLDARSPDDGLLSPIHALARPDSRSQNLLSRLSSRLSLPHSTPFRSRMNSLLQKSARPSIISSSFVAMLSNRSTPRRPIRQNTTAAVWEHDMDSFDMEFMSDRDPQNALPTSTEIRASQRSSRRVTINVAGSRHEVLWRTLDRLPNTRLGKLRRAESHQDLMAICDDYSLEKNEYFFDRNPSTFSTILDFYRTGTLHQMESICVVCYANDLEYWGLPDLFLNSCCQHRFYQRKEQVDEELRKEELSMKRAEEVEDFGPGRYGQLREGCWNLMEKPHTSIPARVSDS
ncbi:hypothetical protein Ciccas_013834 [Cichlidogyrus casuarinus]|uniref:BTB domain-containing protein n=1 Tax=Cichlidogyrus casuarinus TaxID=1844966 RepID=A0ABD2PLU8_9PLAT